MFRVNDKRLRNVNDVDVNQRSVFRNLSMQQTALMHIYRLISRVIRMTRASILVALHICETETIDSSMQLFRKKKERKKEPRKSIGETKTDIYI